MQLHEIDINRLTEASWNPNGLDAGSLAKLRASVERFGLVVPLVARRLGETFEVLSGNQRLAVLRDLGHQHVPCIVVALDAPNAMLLAHALNRLHGVDDPGLGAALLGEVIAKLGECAVLEVLPETAERLRALTSVDSRDLSRYLQDWQERQQVRLRHFTAQLPGDQHEVVERVLSEFDGPGPRGERANRHGIALYRLCVAYLSLRGAA